MKRLLLLIPLLLFSQNDITKYKDKIKPNKEYEINGQDILDVIVTIDSLETVVDSLLSSETEQVLVNSVDTVYVQFTSHRVDTVYDTVYVTQLANKENNLYDDYIFYVVFGILLCFAIWMKLKGENK